MNSIRSLHHSRIGKPPRPNNMERTYLPHEMRAFIEEQALAIFTDMVNGGATLQQTLAAIYLSGVDVGRSQKEN